MMEAAIAASSLPAQRDAVETLHGAGHPSRKTPIALCILDRNRLVGSWTRCVLQSRNDSIQPFYSQAALVRALPSRQRRWTERAFQGWVFTFQTYGAPALPLPFLLCPAAWWGLWCSCSQPAVE